ncbi:hypothetical protein NQ318_009099 [Aromia moschata]|uniref:Methyltransferase domain-containing protein n=1 Tax=Aromia moschata TaxID=1265417 RepID=A0AAV8X1U7_9CUCU|nr:hypothetical protein NQ318_009099 [Aromia moschata]
MCAKYKVITDRVENLLSYLQPLLPLANCHTVDYFSKDIYQKYIPKNIQEEMKEAGEENIASNIFNNDYRILPNLLEYVEECRRLSLSNCPEVCMGTREFQEKLKEWGCEDFLRLKLEIFMTSKKSHEVDVLSFIAAAVRSIAKTSHVIDIGDGKGYLSSMLAMHHKVPVLGVDASATNTNGAVKRVQKLSRVWNSVVNAQNKTRETTADLYKQVTQFVHEDINFSELISNVFLEKPGGLSLVGLHTCGNLAASSLRIFSENEDIKTICNVGCCYHLITEEFENNPNLGLSKCGFPLSEYLKQRRIVIGRAARMIAAQSVERILAKKELPNKTIFYRALLEVLIERKCNSLSKNQRHVGRFRKECTDLNDYVRQATKRLNLEEKITDEEIAELYEQYKARMDELNNFYLIRCMLSSLIESLILLDRLLFLHEAGHENSFLVQLFDPVVSPRCYGLIALK